MLARLDLLSHTEREVLQVASVASRTFSPRLLQNVLPAYTGEEIETALYGLLGRDMIVPAAGGTFRFHHELMLDVTYGTLSRAERIRLHKAIAASLLEEAGEHTDESAELLAYHYYKAVELTRQSAVPQNLVIETERAIKFQVRAGELASRTGASGEALAYFQRAIELAGDAEKVALYEKLGDSLERQWKVKIREAYQSALQIWRTLPERPPLVGARLIRKLIILNNRQYFEDKMPKEEAEALWREGMRLAEAAGDERELWRMRSVALFMSTYELDPLSVEEMRQSEKVHEYKQLAVEAAEYFERCRDWEAFSEILDAYSMLQFRCGDNGEAMATLQRRLQLPDLSFRERTDAISSLSAISLLSGDYDRCIDVVAETLANLRPGEPIEVFANTLNGPLWALYMTGRWSEIPRFLPALDEIWKRIHDIPGNAMLLQGNYLCLLAIALSREDEAEAKRMEDILRRILPPAEESDTLPFTEFYRDGNFSQFKLGNRTTDIGGSQIMLFTEHGLCPPSELVEQNTYFADDLTLRATAIASALAADDNEALARAIDEAEAHHLTVHAARMRIVLARRTGDRSQLERARSVLEPLEDRLFLGKLREVERSL